MSDAHPPETPGDLTGWKDVAAYLGRSVRSVQRWERELGLPVHRIRTQAGEVIYARRGELDGWLESRQGDGATGPSFNGDSGGSDNVFEPPEEPNRSTPRAGGEAPGPLGSHHAGCGSALCLWAWSW